MSDLVPRTRPKPVLTRSLRRRDRLSLVEAVKAYWPGIMPVVALIVAVFGIASAPGDAAFVAVLSIGLACSLLGDLVWHMMMSDGSVLKYRERQWSVYAERLRKTRPHRAIEKTRLRELRNQYERYSVEVEPYGEGVRLLIVEHFRPKKWPVFPFIRWHARKTKKGASTYGTISDKAIALETINNPTTEKVMAALADLNEKAEALENNSYAEAMRKHTAYAVAVASTPPPVKASVRRKVDVRSAEHLAAVEARALDAKEAR